MICDNISSLNNSQSQQNIKVEKKATKKYCENGWNGVKVLWDVSWLIFFLYILFFFFYLAVGNVIIIFDFKIISVFNSIFIYLLVCVCVCFISLSLGIYIQSYVVAVCCPYICSFEKYLSCWLVFIYFRLQKQFLFYINFFCSSSTSSIGYAN